MVYIVKIDIFQLTERSHLFSINLIRGETVVHLLLQFSSLVNDFLQGGPEKRN